MYSTELDFFSEENRMKLAAETEFLPCNLEQNKGQIAGGCNGDSHDQNTEYLPFQTCSEPGTHTLGPGPGSALAVYPLEPEWHMVPQLLGLAGRVEGQRSYFQSHHS